MTPQLEHNCEEDSLSMGSFRETELRLGPPGSNRKEEGEKPVMMLGFLSMGTSLGAKRGFSDSIDGKGRWILGGGEAEAGKGVALGSGVKDGGGGEKKGGGGGGAPAAKAQVVGWPPIRNHRKITMAVNPPKNSDDVEDKHGLGCLYVKVSMDGAPYLRKVDLRVYCNYKELSSALEKMFSCFIIGQCGSHGMQSRDGLSETRLNDRHGSEFVLTYEDKDGDWMLVGDVPWGMFTDTCKRLRIMKGSDAIGLGSISFISNSLENIVLGCSTSSLLEPATNMPSTHNIIMK